MTVGRKMKKLYDLGKLICMASLLALSILIPEEAGAGVCATVKIEIPQELTFERVAFDARMVVTNNLPSTPGIDNSLKNFNVRVEIKDQDGNPANDLFYIRVVSMDNIDAVDGTGTIPAGAAAEIHWLIIPSVGAGGVLPQGKRYVAGATVSFKAPPDGLLQTMPTLPDTITVKPQPNLSLDYFIPRNVYADDPFTETVEAPVPFDLGVRIKNDGYGPANKLKISSGQPRIIENKQGLLVDFRLLSSYVNDSPISPTLNISFGNIQPHDCSTGRWQMMTTLSGYFVDFIAEYSHANELGGDLTSLIKQVNAYLLVRDVLADLPGRDFVKDFLINTDPALRLSDVQYADICPVGYNFAECKDSHIIPDTLYESDCQEHPVNYSRGLASGFPTPASTSVGLAVEKFTGWTYTKLIDPAGGKLPVMEVVRSDGRHIDQRNAWVSEEKPTMRQEEKSVFYFNLLDFDTTGDYTIRYKQPEVDSAAPVTTLIVKEPSYGGDPVHVMPTTMLMLLAEDNLSGVLSMNYRIDGEPYLPAYPFTMYGYTGAHTISFYSRDRAGNTEQAQTKNIFVDSGVPALGFFQATPQQFVPSAPAGSSQVRKTVFSYTASDEIPDLSVKIEIAQGSGQDFAALTAVRSLAGTLQSGLSSSIEWDGRDSTGNIVPPGPYSARLMVSDPLGNFTVSQVLTLTVLDYLSPAAADGTAMDQLLPALSGDVIVWQDFRNDNWDIYFHSVSAAATSNLTSGQIADQERPATDGRYVVWQDRRAGNWDIYLHDTATGITKAITETVNDQTNPALSSPWVVYQEKIGSDEEIHAYNINTGLSTRITFNTQLQINPDVSGNTAVWEDYRHGLAEIYAYDLSAGIETRITNNIHSQTFPSISGRRIVWVDGRDGNRELYSFDTASRRESRLTFTAGDEASPDVYSNWVVYTDVALGLGNTNIGLLNLLDRSSYLLQTEAHRQEWPVISGARIAWQDDRGGPWQVQTSELLLPFKQVVYGFEQGLNITAVTKSMKDLFHSAYGLLNAWKGSFAITSIYAYDKANGEFVKAWIDTTGAPAGFDFNLEENTALYAYSGDSVETSLGELVDCAPLDLSNGFNFVSFACMPENYTAFQALSSLGSGALSISRLDNKKAIWETAAVAGGIPVGADFKVSPGEGYIIYTSSEILNWVP